MSQSSGALPIGPCAQAYWWPGKMILVHPLARTEPGFYISAEPWMALPSNVNHAILGSAIREVLLAFQPNVPVPDYRSPAWKALRLARIRAVGVRSERQFMNGSKLVGISTVGQNLRFTPTRNGGSIGPDRGYRDLPEGIIEAPLTIDTKGLGLKVIDAWARCA
jgi:hypothetical protein